MIATGYPHTLRPELHKALEARGIEYWLADGITFWSRDDGCECLAYGYQVDAMPKLAIKVVGFTDPEHAIAAAMGDADLAVENAKLRELVADMWRFTGTACKKYPRLFDPAAPGGQMVQLNMIDAFEQRMHELGIEEG